MEVYRDDQSDRRRREISGFFSKDYEVRHLFHNKQCKVALHLIQFNTVKLLKILTLTF